MAMDGGNGTGDTAVDGSAGDFDVARASTSCALGAGADIDVLPTTNDAAPGSIDLTGNASSQEIRGDAGCNTLAGGLGNDILTGLIREDAFIFNTTLGAGAT